MYLLERANTHPFTTCTHTCSECYVVFDECDETPCLVRTIGAHGGEVMYFGSVSLRGELGFLNCDDICIHCTCVRVVVGQGFVSTLPAFMSGSAWPVCLKTVNRTHMRGIDTTCTAVCQNHNDSYTNCRLCRLEPIGTLTILLK